MIGWLITSIEPESICLPKNLERFVNSSGSLSILYLQNEKFSKDSFLYKDHRGTVCTDGALFNASELKTAYGFVDLPTFLLESGLDNPIDLIRQFRGPYSGFLHDVTKNCVTLFTNAVGDRPVYVYHKANLHLASSDLNMMMDFCRANSMPLTFNQTAAKMILEFGFCVDTCTMVQEITRLFPGSCLVWDNEGEREIRYHKLDNTENTELSEKEAIEGIDQLFRQAIRRSFGKDIEYGYRHLADISAGMDSRMVNWVAHELGYKNVVNICYGLPSCTDELISSRISSDLGNEYYFRSLRDAAFMLDLDETVRLNFGIAIYIGPTGALRFMKILNNSQIGIRHNGNMGDTLFGAYLRSNNQKEPGDLSGNNASSRSYGPYSVDFSRYQNEEIQNLYARYLLADPVSHVLVRDYTIASSPFMDVDFLNYFLSIPTKFRRGDLYAHWVMSKYPQAANYPYNSTIFTIRFNKKLKRFLTGSLRKVLDVYQLIIYYIGFSKFRFRMTGMNPIGAIYERNPVIQDFYNSYFWEAVDLFNGIPSFQSILKDEFLSGTSTEKALVLTVMSFVKQHGLQVS